MGRRVSSKVSSIWTALTMADSFLSLWKIFDRSCSMISCLGKQINSQVLIVTSFTSNNFREQGHDASEKYYTSIQCHLRMFVSRNSIFFLTRLLKQASDSAHCKCHSPIHIFQPPYPHSRIICPLLAFANLVGSQQIFQDWTSPPTLIRVVVVVAVAGVGQ